MKIAGYLLILAGWAIVVTAVVLLPSQGTTRAAFVLAGIAIEVLGFVLFARAHLPSRGPANDA